MTTIAFDGETLATDSLVTDSGIFGGYMDKTLIKDGVAFAFAGAAASFPAWVNWWLAGKDPKNTPETGGEDCFLIVIDPDGLFEVHSKIPYPVKSGVKLRDGRTVYATGSGFELALGAMGAGKSAFEAVNIAKFFDAGSGGDTIVRSMPWKEELAEPAWEAK